jgi:long-chain fatty acid transport protein
MIKKTVSFFTILAFLAGSVFAGGFQINEHSARAMAMGGAFTGLANDASAAYFNPAGMTQLTGWNMSLGTTIISPSGSFRGVYPETTEYDLQKQTFTPINVYAVGQITDKLYFGFSVNNPFGLGTRWDDDWVGKYLAVDTELKTFYFGFNLAYKINDVFSIAAGLNYAYGDVTIMKYVPIPDPLAGDFKLTLDGDDTAIGYNVSLFIKPSDAFSFGISFRSETPFEFEGTATSEEYPAQLEGRLPSGDITAAFTAPMNISTGVAWHANEKLTLTADYQYVGWSSYDKIEVVFADGSKSVSVRDYDNSWIARVGGEYNFSDAVDFRAGFLYDKNPVKDELVEPSLPDADRMGFNVGLGYMFTEKFGIDLAYMYLRFAERTITNSEVSYTSGNSPFNGTYNSYAHLFAINFSYKF